MTHYPNGDMHLRCEGDTNTTAARKQWYQTLNSPQTEAMLEQDSQYFLHQSMSTPCMNVLAAAEGIYIEDLSGKRYMDFHGNNVHQLGYGHPQVLARIQQQLTDYRSLLVVSPIKPRLIVRKNLQKLLVVS